MPAPEPGWSLAVRMEQGPRPPQIDWDDCPVGGYVQEFDLASGMRGKQVCISFQGVEQAFYVWPNGHFMGYAEDSFTPSNFDLTPYIQERWSCAGSHPILYRFPPV